MMKQKNFEAFKPTIAVDVDDVIAAEACAFVEYSNKKYGTHLTVEDYQEHWGEVWCVDEEEAKKRVHEYHGSGHAETYGIISGAHEVLMELKNNFTLIILTSRRNSLNALTHEWIGKHYPCLFEDIIFTGFYDSQTARSFTMTKGTLAKNIGADYLIDDQLKHILAAAEIGIKGLLFGEYSWNKSDNLPANVIRVRNWQDVRAFFEKEKAYGLSEAINLEHET